MRCDTLIMPLGIENPHTGCIRESDMVSDLNEVVSSWCKMGQSCQKNTCMFVNVEGIRLPLACTGAHPCELFRVPGI